MAQLGPTSDFFEAGVLCTYLKEILFVLIPYSLAVSCHLKVRADMLVNTPSHAVLTLKCVGIPSTSLGEILEQLWSPSPLIGDEQNCRPCQHCQILEVVKAETFITLKKHLNKNMYCQGIEGYGPRWVNGININECNRHHNRMWWAEGTVTR